MVGAGQAWGGKVENRGRQASEGVSTRSVNVVAPGNAARVLSLLSWFSLASWEATRYTEASRPVAGEQRLRVSGDDRWQRLAGVHEGAGRR